MELAAHTGELDPYHEGQIEDGHLYYDEGQAIEGASRFDEFPEEACLFIGDLARGLTEEQLKEPFTPFGVAMVEIKRDRSTGHSLGYGFAYFTAKPQAAAAKKALYKSVVHGRPIRLGWAQKNTNLFIGDLDPSVTTEGLREAFARYGPIYREETFVKHRNYGFVRYKHRKHAEVAKKEMDGTILGSRPIRIGWGEANYQRHCVHIQFDPTESSTITEGDVIAKFEEFGAVTSVNLPRTTQGALRGFGFIYYEDTDEGEDSAAAVIAALNGVKVSGVTLQCNFGKKPNAKKKKSVPMPGSGRRGTSPVSGARGNAINHGSHNAGQGSSQPHMYPVQVMMPIGPGGTWQPVQYMMTTEQAQQFYSSVQYNPHPQHAPTNVATTNDASQLIPMYYTYRVPGKEKSEEEEAEEAAMQHAAMLQQQQVQHYNYGHSGAYSQPATSPQHLAQYAYQHQPQQSPMSYAHVTSYGGPQQAPQQQTYHRGRQQSSSRHQQRAEGRSYEYHHPKGRASVSGVTATDFEN